VIFARNVSRPDQTIHIVPLQKTTPDMADMRTIVIVGSSKTKTVQHGEQKFVYTPRYYEVDV
jgi:precorrin-3B C17-methyltransferase